MARRILVTGGLGYIGTHTSLLLLEAGYSVFIVDNYSNSNAGALERLKDVTEHPERIAFVEADIRDRAALDGVFQQAKDEDSPIFGCIHFAAYKAVGESIREPLKYYDNNVGGSISLIETMKKHNCKIMVFSSSCTVYGSAPSPVTESSPVGSGITNAYAQTKYTMEQMLRHVHGSDNSWQIALLRYFNPVGAHQSGKLGEDPRGIPNCLMPYVLQVLVGRREKLTVFGSDYPTRDGTCIRDYIHVVDVARGHIDALKWLEANPDGVIDHFNFGTGKGTTVLELIAGLELASGKKVNKCIGNRREGDLAEMYCANLEKAKTILGWEARYGIQQICEDAWRFQVNNPMGYHELI